MATTRIVELYDSSGAPMTSGAPVFAVYNDRDDVPRTPPAITHLGGGQWAFTPSDADEAVGVAWLMDANAGGGDPRYLSGAVHLPDNSNQFWVFHFVQDGNVILFPDGSEPIVSYRAADGTDLSGSAPAKVLLSTVDGAVYAITPSASDVAAGVGIVLQGVAGFPAYWHAQVLPIGGDASVRWLPGTPSPVPEPSSTTLFGRMAYVRQLKDLLPPGSLYNLEPGSTLSRTLEAVADELTRVNARGADLVAESDPRTATETLGEWEEMLGLPDERVLEIPATPEERRVAITQKFISRGGQNRAFFDALCQACGYPVINIQTFVSSILRTGFRVDDRVYDELYAYTINISLDTPEPNALSPGDFQRVVRHVTHSHITVMFTY